MEKEENKKQGYSQKERLKERAKMEMGGLHYVGLYLIAISLLFYGVNYYTDSLWWYTVIYIVSYVLFLTPFLYKGGTSKTYDRSKLSLILNSVYNSFSFIFMLSGLTMFFVRIVAKVTSNKTTKVENAISIDNLVIMMLMGMGIACIVVGIERYALKKYSLETKGLQIGLYITSLMVIGIVVTVLVETLYNLSMKETIDNVLFTLGIMTLILLMVGSSVVNMFKEREDGRLQSTVLYYTTIGKSPLSEYGNGYLLGGSHGSLFVLNGLIVAVTKKNWERYERGEDIGFNPETGKQTTDKKLGYKDLI